MDFYRSLFQGVHLEKIKEAINDEDSLHVVLFYRQRVLSNQNDVTFLDTIIAAASFHIKKEFTLLTWMGVDGRLQFNQHYRAPKCDKWEK